jgi:transposase-like protein
MPLSAEADKFVKVASASLPRVSEIIAAFSDEDRADAFELAERRYAQAARDFGCDEAETKRWVTALLRKLRALVIGADSAAPTDLGGATATS